MKRITTTPSISRDLWGNVSPAEFRLFLSGVSDYAIYMLGPDGTVKSWNAGAQRFKGYTAEEIIGRNFATFYPEEDQQAGKPFRALSIAAEQGKYEEEGWRVHKNGQRFWASVVIDPIRDESGLLVGFAKITRDVTERRQVQEALRASEERFRLLVQGVTDYAIYMLSPTGEVTNWNSGAQRIKGYCEHEVIGTSFSRFYTPEDRAAGVPDVALDTARREGRTEMEGWRVRKDGTRFWAHVVIDAIRNDMGDLVGFAKITRDITERKEAALALEQAREALFQAQKMDAIGKLTGGIAHDFNNLLAVVISGLERLKARPAEAPNPKVLASIERAATRASRLTEQLLAFARQQPLKLEKHNLNDLLRGFEPVLRQVPGHGIALQFELASVLGTVMIDATQFEVAMLNLVANARDAMPQGGTLAVITEQVELRAGEIQGLPEGTYAKVTVRDNGNGMSPDVAARALEPFFTTKPVGQGTGMGLSQVFGFVKQSDGDITICTAPGAGTEISIFLPVLCT